MKTNFCYGPSLRKFNKDRRASRTEIFRGALLLVPFLGQTRKEPGSGAKPHAVKMHAKVLLIFLAAFVCASCAGFHRPEIESQLVAEMEGDCKKVEIKRDYQQTVYVIAYTGKVSKDKCPLALIQGWKDGKVIREKEVEICGCRDGRKR